MIQSLIDYFTPHILPLIIVLVVVLVLPLVAGYVVLLERKVMADMQVRLGPMRVGPHGLLQPIADAVKLLLKEDIIPENADKALFWIAPLISVTAAMLAFAGLTFGPGQVEILGHRSFINVADLNIGVLFIVAISSLGIFGIVLGGWASNSHYSLLGALRSSAQMVSYETAAGMALVSGLLLAGSLSTRQIVEAQARDGVWYAFLAPVAFFIYLVASIAETNRAPFDLPEAESELVAGYMTEYSGFRWAIYFLAEYANMIVVAGIATTLFLGGWLRPFASVHVMAGGIDLLDLFPSVAFLLIAGYCFWRAPKQPWQSQRIVMGLVGALCLLLMAVLALALTSPTLLAVVHGVFWFLAKVAVYLYAFMWFRFTFPRYRFDQLMKLGWHFMIPVSIVNVIALGLGLVLERQFAWHPATALGLTTAATLLVAAWLAAVGERRRTAMVGEA